MLCLLPHLAQHLWSDARDRMANRRRPLVHNAVAKNRLEEVKELLADDPSLIFQLDGKGRTPLLLAVEKDLYDMVAELISHVRMPAAASHVGRTGRLNR